MVYKTGKIMNNLKKKLDFLNVFEFHFNGIIQKWQANRK